MAKPRDILTQKVVCDNTVTGYTFNIPAGHTVVYVKMIGVDAVAPVWGLGWRVGNGGVFKESGYFRHRLTAATAGLQAEGATLGWITDNSSDGDANVEILNMNTAAPVMSHSQMGPAGVDYRSMSMSDSLTPYSQLLIFGFDNTNPTVLMNGEIEVTSWKRKNRVFTKTAAADASLEFTDLGKYSMLACSSHNLVMSGADIINLRTSQDGVTYEGGADTYYQHETATQTLATYMRATLQSRTTPAFAMKLSGFNQAFPTTQNWLVEYRGTILRMLGGARRAAVPDEALQFICNGAQTMTSGEIIVVGYEL